MVTLDESSCRSQACRSLSSLGGGGGMGVYAFTWVPFLRFLNVYLRSPRTCIQRYLMHVHSTGGVADLHHTWSATEKVRGGIGYSPRRNLLLGKLGHSKRFECVRRGGRLRILLTAQRPKCGWPREQRGVTGPGEGCMHIDINMWHTTSHWRACHSRLSEISEHLEG